MTSTNLKDSNKNEIFIGSSVVMPDPNEGDNWTHGNFVATVEKVENVQIVGPEVVPMLLVKDSEDDYFHVEAHRVEIED